MSNFNNDAYESLVADLIGDTFYKDISVSGRVSFVRKYAEVVIRKILDIDPNKKVTLGAKNIRNRIKNLPKLNYNLRFWFAKLNSWKPILDKYKCYQLRF